MGRIVSTLLIFLLTPSVYSAQIQVASGSDDDAIDVFQLPKADVDHDVWCNKLLNRSNSDFEDVFRFEKLAVKAIENNEYRLVQRLILKIYRIGQANKKVNDVLNPLENIASKLNDEIDHSQTLALNTYAYAQLYLGDAYKLTHRFKYASQAYQSSIAAYRSGDTPEKQSVPMGQQAKISEITGDYEFAIEQLLKALEASKLNTGRKRYFEVLDRLQLSSLYTQTGKLALAREQLDAAVQIGNAVEDRSILLHAQCHMLQFLVENDKLDKAKALVEEVATWESDVKYLIAREQFRIEKVRYLLAAGQTEKALTILDQIEFMSEACNGVKDFYELAAKVFVANNDFERAFYAQQQLLENSEQKLKSAGQQHREDAETMFQIELKNKEEQSRAEHAALVAQSERTIRNLMIVMTSFVCLAGLLFYRNYSKRKIAKLTLEKQKAINLDLNRMVDEKTAALFSQMEERVELQNALQQKRRIEALGELTGGVAHDFNNLLQVIMTVNELLADSMNEKLTADDRKLIESSNHSAETGAQIIQQMLAFARQQVLQPTAFNVGNFIQSQMPLLKTAAGEQFNVMISNDYPDAVMKVDTAQLTTALINLISNSRDAGTNRNPTIDISIRKFDVEDRVRFPELDGLQHVVIKVEDNGNGMTEDELSRACNPFFTTKRHSTGTGLGLSSVHGFVKQSAGDLYITSQHGHGTKVMLAFPIVRDAKLRSDSKHPPNVSLNSFRVLLVEDHQQVSEAIASKLENLAVAVDVCHSGDAAIKLLQNHTYDCVLSDIRMPGKTDGIELHAWVTVNLPDTFVVLMTGFDHHDRLTENIVLLTKPFTELQLREKLQMARGQIARNRESHVENVKV